MAKRSRAGLFIVLALAAILALLPAGQGSAAVFNPETFTLDNGLQVVVIPNHRTPVVTHMIWYKVGAADEQTGHSGIAHLLEHLMFKGTPTHGPGEFSTLVSRNGGQENAFTSWDYTAYYQSVAKDRLPLVMELEADRMTNLVLNDEQIASEKEVVLEERRQRVENDPGAILDIYADATLFFNHPYRRPIIGWENEIRDLAVADVLAFYRRWYAPNNAILVVAGDVTADEVRSLAERYYGGIARADTPPRANIQEPPAKTPRRIEMSDPRVRQETWSRSYIAPSAVYGARELADPLEVLAYVLGGGPSSLLYRKLVVEDGLADQAQVSYEADMRGPAQFVIGVQPREGVSLATIESAVDAVIADVIAAGVGSEDVVRAKRRLQAEAVYARDSISDGAQVLGRALAIGMPVAHVEGWPARIAAVSADQVNAAARAVLDPGGSVTALLRSEGEQQAAAQ
ncbi:MAG: insulinase family protein [Rhodospirillales bacterium]|nr:insulinase family protein [Rhodospirillales bacterium]